MCGHRCFDNAQLNIECSICQGQTAKAKTNKRKAVEQHGPLRETPAATICHYTRHMETRSRRCETKGKWPACLVASGSKDIATRVCWLKKCTVVQSAQYKSRWHHCALFCQHCLEKLSATSLWLLAGNIDLQTVFHLQRIMLPITTNAHEPRAMSPRAMNSGSQCQWPTSQTCISK